MARGTGGGVTGGVAGSVRYSAALGRRICERVESGESLRTICADAGMPHRSSVRAWAKRVPKLAADLERARTAAGWHGLGGRQPLWCEQTASDICTRLAGGETLAAICKDPTMPSLTTVYYWRMRRMDFAEAVALARQVQAEEFCDLGWEIAKAVEAEVTLERLERLAAAGEPAEAAGPKAVIFYARHFKAETQPDGTKKVVAYLRDSRTGELRREHPEAGEDGEDGAPAKDGGPAVWLS